jgi:hypothetical protein
VPSAGTSAAATPRRRSTPPHWKATSHPVVQSFEPGEDWFWNYKTGEAFAGPKLALPNARRD